MAKKISWKECIEQEIITQINPNKARSGQLLKMASLRLEFWNKEINEKFLALKIEAYYEIIKELIFSLLYKEGYNCSNHLCLITYLKEKIKGFDYETNKIDELRKVRNEITYRGFFTKKDYLNRNELEFKNIVKKLQNLIERKL